MSIPVLLYRLLRYGYTFRRIPLTQGKYAIVDPDDYRRLSKYKWYAAKNNRNWYARRRPLRRENRGNANIQMHDEIIDVPKGMVTDHANRNTLDNRKANLRAATLSQNMRNKGKQNKKSSSIYKGVNWAQEYGKWRARILANGKGRYLGSYKTEIEAAKAYDQAAKKYHKDFACLNFPADA